MLRMARKTAGPGRRRLAGEAFEENLCAVGISRVKRQFQTSAPVGRHRLSHAVYLDRRAPPPCRSRRSLAFRDRAPARELTYHALELQIFGLMHRKAPADLVLFLFG